MATLKGTLTPAHTVRGEMSIGGAGSDNYEDLNHLPQVNGVELKGNKTTEELGINIPTKTSDLDNDNNFASIDDTSTANNKAWSASKIGTALSGKADKSDTYTKSQVDTALSAKANASDTYTKAETDNKIVGLIDDNSTANNKAWSASKIGGELSDKASIAPYSVNIFDGNYFDRNGYVAWNRFNNDNNFRTTKPIYLNTGSYYYNLYSISFGIAAATFAKTNADGTIFEDRTATKEINTITINGYVEDIYSFTISEAGYYMFNAGTVGITETAPYLMIIRQVDGIPTQFIPYHLEERLSDNTALSIDMIGEIKEITNPLYKKSISADGDSICYGNGYLGGYAKIIADNNNMDYQNIAVGGATITAEQYIGGTPRHWVCRSVPNISLDADYIIIEGGVNDAGLNVNLGSISSGYTATLDDTTFYGAIETIFKTLTTKYVGKKSGFIIPHRMVAGMYPNGSYNNAIVECGLKWGVPVLDLSKSIPPFNNFRNTDEYDTIRNAYTSEGDGWHPSEKCYREYYVPLIEAWLKTL